jgi:hypothetical protein
LLATSLAAALLAMDAPASTRIYHFDGAMGVEVSWAWGLSPNRIQCETMPGSSFFADDAEVLVELLVEGINDLGISGVSATILPGGKSLALEGPAGTGLFLDEACPTALGCEPEIGLGLNCMYGMYVEELSAADAAERTRLGLDPLRERRARPGAVALVR